MSVQSFADTVRSMTLRWRRPDVLLILLTIILVIGFNVWLALINNFAVQRVAFTGVEIGTLQSLREIPGFLAFTLVYVLLVITEHRLALLSLVLLGIGTGISGLFPTPWGLYLTTILMSVGFHYFETLRQSLALQWVDKKHAPLVMGRMASVAAITGVSTYGVIWLLLDFFALDMVWIYALGGIITVVLTLLCWLAFPHYTERVVQHKKIILRKRYWLYYAMTFLWGGRRQIFVVFAGFLMVEKFGFTVVDMSKMFLASNVITWLVAPRLGRMINHFGERTILVAEYLGLFFIFVAYAFVSAAWLGVALYILDHIFFSMSFAIKTYFQKIADEADIASNSAATFTINHIMAVGIPVTFGYVWITGSMWVFLAGAAMALGSLGFALLIPRDPKPGNENLFAQRRALAAATDPSE